jgi:hypothetical protein
MRSILVLLLALATAAAPAVAQVVCEKNGKFKLRAACKTTRGETQVVDLANPPVPTPDPAPRTRLLGFSALEEELFAFDEIRRPIQLDRANTEIAFTTTGATSALHVTFSAECAVGTSSVAEWVNLDFVLDGLTLPETLDDDAFCSSFGDFSLDHYRTDSRTVVATGIPAGEHVFEIVGQLVDFDRDGSARLDDKTLSLVIVED